MTYKRRNRKKRRRYPNRITSKSQDIKLNISSLWRYIKRMRRLINVEKKFFDTTFNSTVSTTADIDNCGLIGQGDTEQSRDGNSIRCLSLYGKVFVGQNATATATTTRLIWFIWNNDTDPLVSDILTLTTDPHSHLKPGYGMFKVIKDMYLLTDDSQRQALQRKFYIPLNQRIRFDGNGATDFQRGAIFRLMISSEATNVPTVHIEERLRFVDN